MESRIASDQALQEDNFLQQNYYQTHAGSYSFYRNQVLSSILWVHFLNEVERDKEDLTLQFLLLF